jgi:hypothetical protein
MSQAITFLTYLGAPLALFAGRPNYAQQPVKEELTLPTGVTRAILGSESRRAYATANRYTQDYHYDARDAVDSTDVRKWLERLKTELVAVPMWSDQVTLSTSYSIGATLLNKTALMPTRFASEWIILSDDESTFEIVVIGVVGPTQISVPLGTTKAWPAGTRMYPLLFGRLKERPQFTSETDQHLSGSLVFKESSAYSRKLTPFVVAANLVGSHISGFSLYKLWTVQPNWVKILDTTEADILIKSIGFGRVDSQYAQQNWNRRILELEFLCDRREDNKKTAIEYFFNERKGSTLPFFIPTFRGDLELAADVTAGATTFTIKASRYLDAAFDDPPGNAFIAFVDRNGVYPQRVTSVNATTGVITVESPIGENHPVVGTKISFLMLVRLAESKISWSNETDAVASCRLRYIEQPSEYLTPAPDNKTTAFLYLFNETLPNGTDNIWRYTSYEDALSYAGNTYTPAPISHGRPHYELNLKNSKCDFSTWGGSDFVGNPLANFLPYTLIAKLLLTITRINRDSPNDGSARLIFKGEVGSPKMKGVEWQATIRDAASTVLKQKFPRKLMQQGDNYMTYSRPTGLSQADWKETLLLTSDPTDNQVITVSGSTEVDDWFSGGWIQTGAGANFELRWILSSSVSGSVQTLTIDRPLIFATIGQFIDVYAGYDGTFEQCVDKFGNRDGYGGYPYMPLDNPNFPDQKIETPTGGKK